MNNQDPNSPNRVILSANTVNLSNQAKKPKDTNLIISVLITSLIVIFELFLIIQTNPTPQKNTNNSPKTLNFNLQNQSKGSANPLTNPLNNGSQVNSQLKYCSSSSFAAEEAC